jgi:Trk-type K+ transport system membrane component
VAFTASALTWSVPSSLLPFTSDARADIWWLVWGIFLVSIIERHNLLDDSKKWFDMFHVIFELVSAFGGIGLSLGFPYVRFLLQTL